MRPDLDVSKALAIFTQAPVQPQIQPTTSAVQPIPETTPSSTQPRTTGETARETEAAVVEAAPETAAVEKTAAVEEITESTEEDVAKETVVVTEAEVEPKAVDTEAAEEKAPEESKPAETETVVVTETEVEPQEVGKEAEPAAELVVEAEEKMPDESRPADTEKMKMETGQAVEQIEEMEEKVDEEIEMEKGPTTEVPVRTIEAEEKVATPAEKTQEAEPKEMVMDPVIKEPEVVLVEEDDDMQMTTLEELLATSGLTPLRRAVIGAEEGTQPRMSKRRRRLLMEEPEEEEEDNDEEERVLLEKKRKGKELPGPEQKRIKPASRTVTIRESSPTNYDTSHSAERREAEELTWGRRLKRREERRQESPPYYRKVYVRVDDRLLQQVVRFDNSKWEDECAKRIAPGKMVKSGKRLHQPSLQRLGGEEKFLEYITSIGFEWLLDIDMPEVSVALAQEFFTSFRFKATPDLEANSISFRLCGREMTMSLTEWSVRLGLYSMEQAVNGDWFGRDIGQPRSNPDFDQQSAWRSIVHKRAPDYKPTVSRANHIEDPTLRLAQIFLGYNLLGQANTSSTITHAELYFMWCMKEQRKVHLGYWIAHACNAIATHSVRHLNVCHLLGAFIKNNLTIEMEVGPPILPCAQNLSCSTSNSSSLSRFW